LCPPSVGVCGGDCQEVQVQIGTECPGVHNVDGYCSHFRWYLECTIFALSQWAWTYIAWTFSLCYLKREVKNSMVIYMLIAALGKTAACKLKSCQAEYCETLQNIFLFCYFVSIVSLLPTQLYLHKNSLLFTNICCINNKCNIQTSKKLLIIGKCHISAWWVVW